MAAINWASGTNGNWSTGADWDGGAVPGAADTAVIDPNATQKFIVTVNSPVDVGNLVLDDRKGTLLVQSSLSFGSLSMERGQLELAGGTVSGTISNQDNGHLALKKGGGTLSNVTWQGYLFAGFGATQGVSLTIDQSLTLEGKGGKGAGSAYFNGPVVLNGVTSLDNANIESRGIVTVTGTSMLSFGSLLTVDAPVALADGVALVNNGTLFRSTIMSLDTASSFVNKGFIEGGLIAPASFTNDGTIATDGGVVEIGVAGLQAAGPGGVIDVANGAVIWKGTLTTQQLMNLYTAQHVDESGNYGFGVDGELLNDGATLDVGIGTALGAIETYTYPTTIDGGIVVDHGGDEPATLQNLTLESTSNTLSISGGTWTNVTMSGISVLNNEGFLQLADCNLSGVETLAGGSLELDGNTSVGNGGNLTIEKAAVKIDSTVPAGLHFVDVPDFIIMAGAVLDNTSVVFDAHISRPDYDFDSYTGQYEFGSGFVATIAAKASVTLTFYDTQVTHPPPVTNLGTFLVAGTLTIGEWVTGNGSLILTGGATQRAELDINAQVDGGQRIVFRSHAADVNFAYGQDSAFAGTLVNFSPGDTIRFGDYISAAAFEGHSLVATLSNGATIALATAAAETDSLVVSNADTVMFATGSSSDWSGHGLAFGPAEASGSADAIAAWSQDEPVREWLAWHQTGF